MSAKYRAQAEKLAARRYFKITSLDQTTEGEPIYFARVIELEGCFGQGETIDRALADLHEAMADYIESLLEGGFPVPAPAELIRTTSASAGTTFMSSNCLNNKKLKKEEPSHHYSNLYIPAA